MKFELTVQQQKTIDEMVENNKVHQWFKAKEDMKFQVGDVLIKLYHTWDSKTDTWSWVEENINSDNKMAQRYVYVHEDEYGIGFIKPLRVSDGSLGKDTSCLLDFDFTSTRFQVDPEFAVNNLLGGEFNIKSLHKASLEQRKIINKMNRKIGTKPKNLKEVHAFMCTLKPGDVIWTAHDYNGKYLKEITVTSVKQKTMQQFQNEGGYAYREALDQDPTLMGEPFTYVLNYKDKYGTNDRFVSNYIDYVLFKEKPALEQK